MPTQQRVHLGLARTYQILTLFPRETLLHNVMLALLGFDNLRWNPWSRSSGQQRSSTSRARGARRASASPTAPTAWSPKPPMASGGGWNSPWRWRRSRSCCCSTSR